MFSVLDVDIRPGSGLGIFELGLHFLRFSVGKQICLEPQYRFIAVVDR